MTLKCYVDFDMSITRDGMRYASRELAPWVGGYVYAYPDGDEALCFDMQDRFICAASNAQLRAARQREEAQRKADARMRALVANAILLYAAAAWSCVGLTMLGITGWPWIWALAPMWAPGFAVLCLIVLVDLYRSSRRFARACRRVWSRITRPIRRLA